MSRRARVGIAFAAVVAVAFIGSALVAGWVGSVGISDAPVYQRYGERMLEGDMPYRDFRVEYPPGALAAFFLPALAAGSGDPSAYEHWLAVVMVFCAAVCAVLAVVAVSLLGGSPGRHARAAFLLPAGLLVLGPFTLTRFDLLPAALTTAALAAYFGKRERFGAGMLGLAIGTKLYPVVILPLLVTRAWRCHGRREALGQLGLAVGLAGALYLPFLVLAPEGVARSVWQQLGRPLQIESLGAGILLALHHAADLPLGWASGHGSQNLSGGVAAVAAALTTIAGATALMLTWIRYARGPFEMERLVRYTAAATVAFVAFGKVLSPQFLVWLLPLVPLVAGRRGAAATGLLLLACLLTRLWFPADYWELVKRFDVTASWLVLARDLALVWLFVLLARPLMARERAPARSPSPVPSTGRT